MHSPTASITSVRDLTSDQRVFISGTGVDPGDKDAVGALARGFREEFDVFVPPQTMRRLATAIQRKERRYGSSAPGGNGGKIDRGGNGGFHPPFVNRPQTRARH